MHIVMLSDFETQGGAAISASRLARALCRAQHRVTRILAGRDGFTHPWATVELWPSLPVWGMRHVMPSGLWQEFCAWLDGRQLAAILGRLRPDVINIHNLHAMTRAGWSVDLVRVCAKYAPTVWTLHDMWSFTGRCAYSYDCDKFKAGCDDACPTPTEYPALAPNQIVGAWQKRRVMLSALLNLVAVTPSAWLRQQARSGLWSQHRTEVIPYGLPLDVYRPVDRVLARSELGLEPQGPVLLMSAADLTERRKGGAVLVEALRGVSQRPLTLITLGSGQLNCESSVKVHQLGYVEDERTKVMAYNAADAFVHPAPVDNLPNTVMEALACGTPVVAFPIGGLPEMIRPGKTGWLAETLSADALARAIVVSLEEIAQGVSLRANCRAVAEAEYSGEQQANQYVALFESLLASAK